MNEAIPATPEKKKTPRRSGPCESCLYCDYNEEDDAVECRIDLDEDEYRAFLTQDTANCPYYVFYDEYKSVQKQN
jgi:hypothetical protein